MTNRSDSIYQKLVKITGDYLGLAAERFIDRQIENHLNIKPENLTSKDLKKLISWIRVAVSLLTDDTEVVDSYCQQIENLANHNSNGRNVHG